MDVQGFVLGKSRQRTAVFSKAGSGGTRPGLQLSSSFTANHNLKQNLKVESDDSDVDTLPSGPEKELLQKLELVELQKYDSRFPRIMKGDPNLFDDIKRFGWDNFVEKDDMQLSFKWLSSRRKINILMAQNLQEFFPPKLVGVAEDWLTTDEFFLKNLQGNYTEDIDSLKEFATAIRNNLLRDIMIGNFVLPQKVPSLTLMIKDSSYKLIPTPVVSNFEEEQTTTLTTTLLENIKLTQSKRNLVSVDNS